MLFVFELLVLYVHLIVFVSICLIFLVLFLQYSVYLLVALNQDDNDISVVDNSNNKSLLGKNKCS